MSVQYHGLTKKQLMDRAERTYTVHRHGKPAYQRTNKRRGQNKTLQQIKDLFALLIGMIVALVLCWLLLIFMLSY